MPSFADSIFLFVLALLLFGPKKLPVLARELGKWMGEFRRASNEFKMQMNEELRLSEQAERQQKIAAMEAAAPVPPPLNDPPEPEHPHLRNQAPNLEPDLEPTPEPELPDPEPPLDGIRPIATSGSLNMMPPATGLPTPRSSRPGANPLGSLVDAIPGAPAPESVTHAD